MLKTKCRWSLKCFCCCFPLFSAVVTDFLRVWCPFLLPFSVRSVGEPGEERAQGPGPTAGVWREGGSAGEPRLPGQFSRGVTVWIFYSRAWDLRIPLFEHHPKRIFYFSTVKQSWGRQHKCTKTFPSFSFSLLLPEFCQLKSIKSAPSGSARLENKRQFVLQVFCTSLKPDLSSAVSLEST